MATWAERFDAAQQFNREQDIAQEQRDEQRRRRNALNDIFAAAYEPEKTTTQEMYGPTQTGEALPPLTQTTPGRFNVQNALAGMARGGFAPEALQYMQSKQAPDQWEQVQGPRGTLIQRNRTTGEMKSVIGTPERAPDWTMPGYIDAQRQIAEAKGEGRLSPTSQKELFEADETIQSSANVVSLLKQGLELNDKAFFGPLAKTRAKMMSLSPGDTPSADATINLDNLMTGQALESLKAVFGGMPTEGERKILLDMQASVDKTPTQRKDILDRAIELANRRMEFNKSKAESIRKGKYFKQPPVFSDTELKPTDNQSRKNVGDIVNTKSGRVLIQKINPDGSYEGIPAR